MTYTIKTLNAGTEATVLEMPSANSRDAAAMARSIRNDTGLETRVYDMNGLCGIMDARA